MIEARFKNKTEQEQQRKAYTDAQKSFKVFGAVGPYYITWLMLSLYRIDRGMSYNILIVLIGLVAGFEIQVRLKYGTGQFEVFFRMMQDYFPVNFTVG